MSGTLPDYWIPEVTASVNTVLSNISKIKNSSNNTPRTSTFFFITDTHWRGNAKNSPNVALHVADAIDAAIDNDSTIPSSFKTRPDVNGYRKLVFAGDSIKGNAGTKNGIRTEAEAFLNAWDSSFHLATALGNHDTNRESRNASENILTSDEMYDLFFARESEYVTRDNINKDTYIGWFDDTVNKIRYFTFRHYDYDNLSETVWNTFTDAISEIENDGWGAIFFCHAFWNLKVDSSNPGHAQIPSESIAFASDLADRCCDKGIIPIALMVGHIHADDYYIVTTENNHKILVTATVCDTYIGEATKLPAISMEAGNSTEQAFEVVQIDMNSGKLYFTRVGAGFDRIFNILEINSEPYVPVPVLNPDIYNEGINVMSVKFINLENLSDFWDNAKNYIDYNDNTNRQEIEDKLDNWQKTEKASVVQCEPVSNSDLHPVVNFSFTETLPAEGEKGPDNPSTVTGVSSVNIGRIGKNLLLAVNDNTSFYGISITRRNDGSYLLNGTSTSGQERYFPLTDCGEIYAGPYSALKLDTTKTYTLSATVVSGSITGGASVAVGSAIGSGWIPGRDMSIASGGSVTATRSAASLVTGEFICRLNIGSGTSFNNVVLQVQLEEGDTATAFEAPILPVNVNYAISLNNTYYGGSVDLFTGLMTVTHAVLTLNENVNYTTSSSGFVEYTDFYRLTVYPSLARDQGDIINRSVYSIFPITTSNTTAMNCIRVGTNSKAINIDFQKTYLNLENGADFNTVKAAYDAFFSEHPAIFVYPVATPFTVQLTPQQIKSLPSLEGTSKRINTLYTDADSIQVKYQKYVGIDSTIDSNSVNAIQNKAVNSALSTKVSLSGDEVINGTKTFSNTINGNITGNAGTVAGHIVSKNVPVDAAFTDTTYDPATQSTAGLMSASDKVKLDAVGSVFTFKGSVIDDTYLPASDNVNGDAYFAEDTGHVHVYDGTSFVDIGVWAGIPSATDAQIDALFED